MQFVVEPGQLRYRIVGGATEGNLEGEVSISGLTTRLNPQRILPTQVAIRL